MSFTFVSKQVNFDGSGAAIVDLPSTTFTSGRLYVAFIRWTGASGTTLTSIDVPNSTPKFTLATKQEKDNGEGAYIHGSFAYWIADSTSTVVPVAHLSTSLSQRVFQLFEYTVSGTPTLDVESVTGNGSSSSPASAAFNTAGTDELVLGGLVWHKGGTAPTFSAHAINGSAADNTQSEGESDKGTAVWDKTFAATFTGGTASVTSSASRVWAVNAIAFSIAVPESEVEIVRTSVCVPIMRG